jgi:hypothetical protein
VSAVLAAALIGVVCLSLLPGTVPARAQSGLRVTGSAVEASFPLMLSFRLSATSDVDITDVRLRYTVDRLSFAEVIGEAYVQFAPSSSIDVSWEWDMRRTGGLPSGTAIEYWWLVTNASGDFVRTDPATVQFDDDRYTWRTMVEGQVALHWYDGDSGFAGEIMEAVQDSLVALEEDTGAHLMEPIDIYVYGSSGDLRGSMVFPQEWTGGVAFTRYGSVAIGISPNNLQWGRRAITHELTHLVVHQMTLNPYGGLPTWLEEGLAMRAEGPLGPEFELYLERAIDDGTLISLRSLSSPFSAKANESILSYAESFSAVDFLVETYGGESMLELLDAFREGNSYDGALRKVYGFNTEGLDSLWRRSLLSPVQASAGLVPAGG